MLELEELSEALKRAADEPQSFQGFLLVKQRTTRLTKRGDPFLQLTLVDAEAAVTSVVFSDHSAYEILRDPETGFIAVRGVLENNPNYGMQLVIREARPVRESDRELGFDESRLVPSTPYDIDALWQEALELVESIAEESLREVVRELFVSHEDELREAPAARTIHQAYRGGLLEHSVFVARDARYYADKYPELDADLLLAGALLHDIGKLAELDEGPPYDYTDEGRLMGHLYQGARMVEEAARAGELDPRKTSLLVHMLLSHHGEREYGAVTTPKTREAVLLHYLDNIDAKLAIFRRYVDQAGPGNWTEPSWELGRSPLWKGEEA